MIKKRILSLVAGLSLLVATAIPVMAAERTIRFAIPGCNA